MLGRVKFFNMERGFGFISADDGQDYFCHISEVRTEGIKILIKDQSVEFEESKNSKGLLARNIIIQE